LRFSTIDESEVSEPKGLKEVLASEVSQVSRGLREKRGATASLHVMPFRQLAAPVGSSSIAEDFSLRGVMLMGYIFKGLCFF